MACDAKAGTAAGQSQQIRHAWSAVAAAARQKAAAGAACTTTGQQPAAGSSWQQRTRRAAAALPTCGGPWRVRVSGPPVRTSRLTIWRRVRSASALQQWADTRLKRRELRRVPGLRVAHQRWRQQHRATHTQAVHGPQQLDPHQPRSLVVAQGDGVWQAGGVDGRNQLAPARLEPAGGAGRGAGRAPAGPPRHHVPREDHQVWPLGRQHRGLHRVRERIQAPVLACVGRAEGRGGWERVVLGGRGGGLRQQRRQPALIHTPQLSLTAAP